MRVCVFVWHCMATRSALTLVPSRACCCMPCLAVQPRCVIRVEKEIHFRLGHPLGCCVSWHVQHLLPAAAAATAAYTGAQAAPLLPPRGLQQMEQQLGITSFRLPPPEAGLAELASSPLFAGAAADAHPSQSQCLEPAQLAAWARCQRQQPVTALDWRVVLSQLAGGKGAQQIVSLLSWAAEGAVQQLELAASGRAAQGGGGDAGNPRHQQALQNTLKLSLALLCCIARGQGGTSQAEHEDGQQAGKAAAAGTRRKKAKSGGGGAAWSAAAAAAATAALAQLQLRRDALRAVLAISDAFASGNAVTLLPAVSDLRAAERLWRACALHCLVHPPTAAAAAAGSGDTSGSAKAAMEAAYRALAGGCCPWSLKQVCRSALSGDIASCVGVCLRAFWGV